MKTAKIELHLHLDGSLNLKWAYYKALQREVIPEKETFEEFYALYSVGSFSPYTLLLSFAVTVRFFLTIFSSEGRTFSVTE